MSQDSECRVSVNLLLEAAHRLFAHNKVPLALALVLTVLEQYPQDTHARMLYQMFTGAPAPDSSTNKTYRLFYDFENGSFVVVNKNSGVTTAFDSLEEAEKYLQDLK